MPVGALLDRIGPKYTSLLGAAVFGAGNIVFPLGYRGTLRDDFEEFVAGEERIR